MLLGYAEQKEPELSSPPQSRHPRLTQTMRRALGGRGSQPFGDTRDKNVPASFLGFVVVMGNCS